MDGRLSVEEFIGWRAFDTISPIGDQRAIRQAALTASILWNANRGRRDEPRGLDDFDLYHERKVLTRAEEEARFRAAWQKAGLVVSAN